MSPNRYTTHREPVSHRFDRSASDLQTIHNEKRYRHTTEKGPISAGMGTPRVEQHQTSESERGNRSPLVRHLIWLRNPKGFHFRVRDGGSPGSSAYISNGKTDGWSLLSKGNGSRSCVLVSLIIRIICCVWKSNCWSIRRFIRLSHVYFPWFPLIHQLLRKFVCDGEWFHRPFVVYFHQNKKGRRPREKNVTLSRDLWCTSNR